jgi:hypothetical protein
MRFPSFPRKIAILIGLAHVDPQNEGLTWANPIRMAIFRGNDGNLMLIFEAY